MTSTDGESDPTFNGDLTSWLKGYNLDSLAPALIEQGFDLETLLSARENDLWALLDDIKPPVKPAMKIKFVNAVKKSPNSKLYKDQSAPAVNIIYNAAELSSIEKLIECIKKYEDLSNNNPTEKLKTLSNEAREKISVYFDELLLLKNERKNFLLNCVDEFENETLIKLQDQQKTGAQFLEELNSGKDQCNKELSNVKDISKLLERKEKINKFINDLLPPKQEYLKKIIPVHLEAEFSSYDTSRIHYIIKNIGSVIRPDIPRYPIIILIVPLHPNSIEVTTRHRKHKDQMEVTQYEFEIWMKQEKSDIKKKNVLIDLKNSLILSDSDVKSIKKDKQIEFKEEKLLEDDQTLETEYVYCSNKITELKINVSYLMHLRCKNDYGWSPFTTPIQFKLPDIGYEVEFTTLGAQGSVGPPSGRKYYLGQLHEKHVDVQNGIQFWTVPYRGIYHITAFGACGGNNNASPNMSNKYGGGGAVVGGEFELDKGDIIRILVGQKGLDWNGSSGSGGAGGGGGSFIVSGKSDTPLLIAGGGNGSSWGSFVSAPPYGLADQIENRGNLNSNGRAGKGGGFSKEINSFIGNSATYNKCIGLCFLEGGAGGQKSSGSEGGFGGGGGSEHEGGGGGGYIGGCVVQENKYNEEFSKYGAISFNSSKNKTRMESNANKFDGKVIVKLIRATIIEIDSNDNDNDNDNKHEKDKSESKRKSGLFNIINRFKR